MKALTALVKKNYGIDSIALQPHGPVWKLSSSSGTFLLKRMACPEAQLYWLAATIEQLIAAGFNGLSQILRTKSNRPFFQYRGQNFIITSWYNGEHPSFTKPLHLQLTSSLLGQLHLASKKIFQSANLLPNNPLNDLTQKIAFLETLINMLKNAKENNRINRSILHWSDHYLAQAYLCIEECLSLNNKNWFLTSNQKGFCHQDPAPRNIIIMNNRWILIDYELSGINLFAQEITTLLLRALSINHWQPSLIDLILENYNLERNLAEEEYSLIRIWLLFPRKFWRLCSQRFEEQLDWKEKHYQSKFWMLYQEEKERCQLLKSWFPQLKLDI